MTAKGVVCERRNAELIVKCRNGSAVLRGTLQDNSYYINCEFVLPAEGQGHVSLHAWHSRLSHPALSTLKRMARKEIVHGLGDVHKEPDFKCKVCIAAKMEQASHPRSTARAKTQCELLHNDVLSLNEDGLQTEGMSYVLTVMDDYSRYAEVTVIASSSFYV
jgi:hypothetical protein